MQKFSRETVFSEVHSLRKDERRITRELIERFAFIDQHRLYAEIGYSSLFLWLRDEMKYSKPSAYRRLQAVRLFSLEQKREVLKEIEMKSCEQAERIIAEEFDIKVTHSVSPKALAGNQTKLTLILSAEQMALLTRVKAALKL